MIQISVRKIRPGNRGENQLGFMTSALSPRTKYRLHTNCDIEDTVKFVVIFI
jgi:hypothetical protein